MLWLWNNLAFSFVVGFFFGLFAVDLFSTLQVAARIRAFAEKHRIETAFRGRLSCRPCLPASRSQFVRMLTGRPLLIQNRITFPNSNRPKAPKLPPPIAVCFSIETGIRQFAPPQRTGV